MSGRILKLRKEILLVDDHPITRHGLAQLINHEKDLKVCGEVENAHQALAALTAKPPDLILTDISLPGKSGLEFIKDVKVMYPELPVLAVSMHDEAFYAERVLRAGGSGYIQKREGREKILRAIRTVLSGQIYVSEKMSARILDIFSGRSSVHKSPSAELLTDREFEVFQLIGQGRTTREIAKQLHLSVKTVEVHRLNIKQKLKLKTGSELVYYAVRWAVAQKLI